MDLPYRLEDAPEEVQAKIREHYIAYCDAMHEAGFTPYGKLPISLEMFYEMYRLVQYGQQKEEGV